MALNALSVAQPLKLQAAAWRVRRIALSVIGAIAGTTYPMANITETDFFKEFMAAEEIHKAILYKQNGAYK